MASTDRRSISNAVASVVTHNPALHECLQQKVLNYHALAANIKPEVERLADRQTTINTIVVALTRLSGTIDTEVGPRPSFILKDARIRLASDVVDVTIRDRDVQLRRLPRPGHAATYGPAQQEPSPLVSSLPERPLFRLHGAVAISLAGRESWRDCSPMTLG